MILQRALLPAANSGGLVTSGLVAHFDAGNPASYPGSGSTWSNLISGVAWNGTLPAGVTYSTAGGGSLVFAGAGASMPLGANWPAQIPSGTAARTFCAFYRAPLPHDFNVFAYGGNEFDGCRSGVGMLTFNGWNYFSDHRNAITYTTATQLWNQWQYQCWSMPANAIVSQGKHYLNGQLRTTIVASGGTVAINTTKTDARIGNLTGSYAIAKIYDRQLTDAEILQNFEALRGRFGI